MDIKHQVTEAAANFKRGVTDMLLLSLLAEKERYAYELSKTLAEYSQGFFSFQGPALYTVLYRLEQKGFVTTRDEQVGHRIRVYYRVLPKGEEYLKEIIKEYSSISKGILAVLSKTGDAVL
jgi:PadR family transcriptional regulator PadR